MVLYLSGVASDNIETTSPQRLALSNFQFHAHRTHEPGICTQKAVYCIQGPSEYFDSQSRSEGDEISVGNLNIFDIYLPRHGEDVIARWATAKL